MVFRLFIILLMSVLCFQVQAASNLQAKLDKAYKDISAYVKTASSDDLKNFATYINFYRSEGGYQTVTPAPKILRDSLSQDAKELFGKLKRYARPFTKQLLSVKPGASKLTKEGEEFYTKVKSHLHGELAKTSTSQTVKSKAQ